MPRGSNGETSQKSTQVSFSAPPSMSRRARAVGRRMAPGLGEELSFAKVAREIFRAGLKALEAQYGIEPDEEAA